MNFSRKTHNEMSIYLTITYHPTFVPTVGPISNIFQQHFRQISTKKCLTSIFGLISQSFELSNIQQMLWAQNLLVDRPLWMKHDLKISENINYSFPNEEIPVMQIALGYLATSMLFLYDQMTNLQFPLIWMTNVDRRYATLQHRSKPIYEMRLDENCLDRYFLFINRSVGGWTLILPLRVTPRCFRGKGNQFKNFSDRVFDFSSIDFRCLSESSALYISFFDKPSLDSAVKFLIYVMKLDLHQGPIQCLPTSPQNYRFDHRLDDFWSSYAFQTLLSLGSRIKNQFDLQLHQKIINESNLSRNDRYPNHRCYLKLMAVYLRARADRFFYIQNEYDQVPALPPSNFLTGWCYVPRVYLTPYGIYPMMIKPMRSNRVLRENERFGPNEHFCRVILRDVDFSQAQKGFVTSIATWISDLIIGKSTLMIGNKSFEFLLSSNSQLRDRSFWFYSKYKDQNAVRIRQWMGDFSKEKCVGKYVSRMGLTLTGTTATISLDDDQMELIDDKFDAEQRIFTDGTGKISGSALREVLNIYNPRLLTDDAMPLVIQIRLNGIKGVLAYAPDLDFTGRGTSIQYRPSQKKFDCRHNVLEIVKHCSAGPAFLNRQVIVLLENMGIPHHQFLRLQNESRLKISMSLLDDEVAEHTLKQNVQTFDWQQMRRAGIHLTNEPFARDLLLLIAQEKLKRIKEKTNIPLSMSNARMLMGVVDETDSLDYGQVFIQLRDLNRSTQILQSRQVLMTKNPAHFPGDILKLNVVDCPSLHHLYDCVVFPAKGPRPHPNEMSGGDTDGDEFWVCWDENLVQSATIQYPPAEFDTAGKKIHPGEITMQEIAEFLVEYLSADALGILSTRHLVVSSIHGPNHENAYRLAGHIAEAVDFPKTGILPTIPNDIPIREYPDFMEKNDQKQFICDKALGVMYRQIFRVHKLHVDWTETDRDVSIEVDGKFVVQGHEKFLRQGETDFRFYTTRMNSILSMYGLTSEYELISGIHLGAEEEKKNNDSVQTASLDYRSLVNEMRTKFHHEDLSFDEKVQKASAYYVVAYRNQSFLSFAWLNTSFLSSLAERHRSSNRQEKHVLKRIGEALIKENHDELLRKAAVLEENKEKLSDEVTLGEQFLDLIETGNKSADQQDNVHVFLTFLHRVALGIV